MSVIQGPWGQRSRVGTALEQILERPVTLETLVDEAKDKLEFENQLEALDRIVSVLEPDSNWIEFCFYRTRPPPAAPWYELTDSSILKWAWRGWPTTPKTFWLWRRSARLLAGRPIRLTSDAFDILEGGPTPLTQLASSITRLAPEMTAVDVRDFVLAFLQQLIHVKALIERLESGKRLAAFDPTSTVVHNTKVAFSDPDSRDGRGPWQSLTLAILKRIEKLWPEDGLVPEVPERAWLKMDPPPEDLDPARSVRLRLLG